MKESKKLFGSLLLMFNYYLLELSGSLLFMCNYYLLELSGGLLFMFSTCTEPKMSHFNCQK